MSTVGWGVAGCGWVARDHAAAGRCWQTPGARLVALHDRDPAARWPRMAAPTRARHRRPRRRSWPRRGLDAVYVATPNAAHRPVVEAAAAAGIAVLCEKPLAADVADAEAAVAAAARAGVLLGTAFDQRWHPAHVRLRELVAGELGTVTAVRIVYCCWLPADWSPDVGGAPRTTTGGSTRPRAGGGALIDLAPHGLDLVGILLAATTSSTLARARCRRRVQDYPVDDGALLVGRTAGGVLVDLHVAYNCPDALPRRRLEVVGTRGMARRRRHDGPDRRRRADAATAPTPVDVPFAGDRPVRRPVRRASRAAVAGTGRLALRRRARPAPAPPARAGPRPATDRMRSRHVSSPDTNRYRACCPTCRPSPAPTAGTGSAGSPGRRSARSAPTCATRCPSDGFEFDHPGRGSTSWSPAPGGPGRAGGLASSASSRGSAWTAAAG